MFSSNINIIIFGILFIILFLCLILFHLNNIMHIILVFLLLYLHTCLLFICMELDFIAFMILIIYGGAIVILFIFVIMLISLKKLANFDRINLDMLIFMFLMFIFFKIIMNGNDWFLVLLFNIYNFDTNQILQFLNVNFYLVNLRNMFVIENLLAFSDLVSLSICFFKIYWIQTLLLGYILLLALILIIYIFKK